MTNLDVVVLGASGGIGGAIAHELLGRGHRVRAANRAGDTDLPGAVPVAVDLEAADAAERLAAVAADSDVVVLAAQPPYEDWFGRWERMLEAVITGTARAGARLVFVDNLYAYGVVDGPIGPDTPERPDNPKTALRRDLGQRVLAAHRAGEVRATIGRFSDYVGPGGENSGLYMLGLQPLLDGRTPMALLDADQPHTWHYLPDAARAFATLVEDDRADGRVWVLPAAPPLTQREAYALLADLLGRPAPRVRTLTAWLLRLAAPLHGPSRAALQVAAQFDRPWVVDGSAFEATFGRFEPTPLEEAFAATIAWAQGQRASAPRAA